MARIPAVLFLVETEQRKIYDPEEIKPVRINRQFPLPSQNVGAIQPDLAENFARVQPLVSGEQNQIAFFDGQFFCERGLLAVVEEFHDGRFPLTTLDLDISQPFGTETFGVLGHGVNLALRHALEKWGYMERPKTPWLRLAPDYQPKAMKFD